jgi:hypothetical protein
MIQHHTSCTSTIETDGKPIDATELADFLILFRAVYAHVVSSFLHGRQPYSHNQRDIENIIKSVRSDLSRMSESHITSLAHSNLYNDNLGISNIKRENPLTLVFEGAATALVVATIISGGRLNFEFIGAKVNVNLPPLGKGITALRKAFSPSTSSAKKRTQSNES